MGYINFIGYQQFLFFLGIFAMAVCWGTTDPRDVYAINSLYAAFGSPRLPGWIAIGGDPCGLGWQGVQCVNANVTGIVLSGSNLGGKLSEDLGYFASIIQIDLRDNHIGGPIPSNLPPTVRSLFLSGNQFTGSIPDTISSLGQLSDLYLDNNHLMGVIPDAFQQLQGLITIELSGNKLSGQLPSSMGNLNSLTTLHLQNNQLIGTLDVLEDLPLTDLNIENNLFSGPIPEKLLSIPNFRKDGNPFNTTALPSPPVSSPSPSPLPSPSPSPIRVYSPELAPQVRQAAAPQVVFIPDMGNDNNAKPSRNISWLVIAGLLAIIVLTLVTCLLLSRCCKRRPDAEKIYERRETYAHGRACVNAGLDDSLQVSRYQALRASRESFPGSPVGDSMKAKRGKGGRIRTVNLEGEDHRVDVAWMDSSILPPPPPPFVLLPSERIIPDPILPILTSGEKSAKSVSLKSFTVTSLQQYTHNFSLENLFGKGMLGAVYKAELPNGIMVAVKKLYIGVSRHHSDQAFLDLVDTLSKLQHPNIVKLVGHCLEHRQRLLVYECCKNGTLHEALHVNDEIRAKLSWNIRTRLALQAAKALEYLHEICQPPIVHKNFKSANILLDDDLAIRVSDCGLAPLLPPNSMAQLQGCGYGAPELEFGNYTVLSDVYSFGVVMLELLTGRKSHDRSRPPGGQFLVRWAIPRLHDVEALSRMVDPSLNGAYPSKSLSRFADIISSCIQPEPEFRSPMSEVVQNLLQMVKQDL